MKEFAIGRGTVIFASIFGVLLFLMNFVLLFVGSKIDNWWTILIIVVITIIYLYLIFRAIFEKTKPLPEITHEELEEAEYDRVDVDGFETTTVATKRDLAQDANGL